MSPAKKDTDRVSEVLDQRRESSNWLESSYWSEWEKVYKHYGCQMDERKDADGKIDKDKSHVAMPDTFSMVNRRTARVTANIPDIRFIADKRNDSIENQVSHKVMWDWDNGGIQRTQKRHVRQADMFGWSVRGWWWEVREFTRRRGVDVRDISAIPPMDMKAIASTYDVPDQLLQNPQSAQAVMAELTKRYARRGLLDVRYLYKGYEGPRSRVMFIGDCYPQPYFETLQTSGYFIVNHRRDEDWLTALAKRYPELAAGVQQLFEDHPKGTEQDGSSINEEKNLKNQMRAILGRATSVEHATDTSKGSKRREWTICERWTPGQKSKVAYVGEDQVWIGEIPAPYELDGNIPYTDLKFIDDVLGGIGDSVGRVSSGLQDVHNRMVNRRFDLIDAITYPLVFTSDRSFFENPEVLRRDLMRLVWARGGSGSVWTPVEQASIAACAASLQEEGALMRMFQMASGDSNMSMSANVDPAQVRTATGARMLQSYQDVLTKDMVDMFNYSVTDDANMIYLLNRSEMADAVPIEPARYMRNYNPNLDTDKMAWIQAEPVAFQVDGKLMCRLGSTLADDDEVLVAKATNMYQMLHGHPLVNEEQIVQDLLIAHGKGPDLHKYMKPQQPGGPEVKSSVSFNFKSEDMDEAQRRAVMTVAGIPPEMVAQMEQQVSQEAVAQQTGLPALPPAGPPPGNLAPGGPGGGQPMAPPEGAPPPNEPVQ